MLDLKTEAMRGPGSIPTGGNILSLDFFQVVKPLMPILALLPILSICENLNVNCNPQKAAEHKTKLFQTNEKFPTTNPKTIHQKIAKVSLRVTKNVMVRARLHQASVSML